VWWTNLVFVTNLNTCFCDEDEVCQAHLWTVSAEFQMYLFTPFVAYVFVQHRAVGTLLAIGMCAVGIWNQWTICDGARTAWKFMQYYCCGMLASFSYNVGAR
jgi:peptidoglycan/LPS O-acetylase OafA/YrhL